MAVKIITDSSSELQLREMQQKRVTVIPMRVIFDDESFKVEYELSKEQFYKKLLSGVFPKTSQPSPADFENEFREVAEQGDSAVVILLSSALSGTVQSAQIAKETVGYEQIYIIDSKTATYAQHLLVEQAVHMRDAGAGAAEIAAAIEELKPRVQICAALNTLQYLYKGGRLTRLEAGLGTMANLKPIVRVSEKGTVKVCGKAIGKVKANGLILKKLLASDLDPAFPLRPIYCYDQANCVDMLAYCKKNGLHAPMRNMRNIGACIGPHIGPGGFGFVYVVR